MPDAYSAADLSRCEEALRFATEQGDWDSRVMGKVRQWVGEEMAAMVMATARLQTKARAKLGDGIWWCTERSLSQATAAQVATMKARWIRSKNVFDLCCGMGSDSSAIARCLETRTASMVSVDADPMLVAMASENVRMNVAGSQVSFRCGDVAACEIPSDSAIHIDPDRRNESGRKTRPDDYSPSWEIVCRIASRSDSAVIKLAPAAELDDEDSAHRMWISLSGTVREQTLLLGRAIESAATDLDVQLPPGGRSAVAVDSSGHVSAWSRAGHGKGQGIAAEWSQKPKAYLIDPDAAIRAAGLTESFAAESGLGLLGGPSGFLTSDEPVENGMAMCERVIWTGSCDDRKLRKTLRSLNCFPWRVKTRGVSQNPNLLEKRYRPCGEKPVTLWIGKTAKRQFAALTETQQSD